MLSVITMLATLAGAGLAVSSAWATPTALPEFTVQTGFTATSGASSLETKAGIKISCAKSTTEGTAFGKQLGTFHLALKECTTKVGGIPVKCTGLGDPEGVMLVLGNWLLVAGPEEQAYMWFLVTPEAQAECVGLSVKVHGTFLAKLTPVGVETSEYALAVKQTGGKQEPSEFLNDEGASIKVEPLFASVNGGLFEETGLSFVEFKLTTEKLTKIAAPPPPPAAPRVEWIDFGKNQPVIVDHEKEVEEEVKTIEEVGGKDKVEWKSPKAGEVTKNWPLAYVQNEKVKLEEARFGVAAATRKFLEEKAEGEPEVVGEAVIGGVAIKFKKTFTLAELKKQFGEHGEYITTGAVESANALPEKVFYELATITWKWGVKEKGREKPFEQGLGTSKHNLYVLFRAPLAATEIFLTILDLETRNAAKEAQPLKEPTAITGVWKGFANVEGGVPSVHVRTYNPASETGSLEPNSKKVLEYYGEIVKPGKNLEEVFKEEITAKKRKLTCPGRGEQEMLEKFAGRCGGWALTLINAFAVEGIESKEVDLYVEYGKGDCAIKNLCVMLVKNWKFGKKGAAPFPFAAKETEDLEGVAGQGVKNPPPFFWDHAIVKVGAKGSGVLYDPSYGNGPFPGTEVVEKATETSVLEEFEKRSLDGFCAPETPTECVKASELALAIQPEVKFEFP
ncbi:MAG TPA: hypothetical protein VL988_09575 [Solirubrobacteraceae bacterium]|nr:hypothetical protein [Solirubrobacteraceae bacterium]